MASQIKNKKCPSCGWDMEYEDNSFTAPTPFGSGNTYHEDKSWFCTNPNCAHEEDYEEE